MERLLTLLGKLSESLPSEDGHLRDGIASVRSYLWERLG